MQFQQGKIRMPLDIHLNTKSDTDSADGHICSALQRGADIHIQNTSREPFDSPEVKARVGTDPADFIFTVLYCILAPRSIPVSGKQRALKLSFT